VNALIQVLAVLLPVAYLAAVVVFGMSFAGDKNPLPARATSIALTACILLHGAFFGLYWHVTGALPIFDTWLLVSAAAFTTALLFALQALRGGLATVGCIVLIAVFGLQFSASAFGPIDASVSDRVVDTYTVVHVGSSLVAVAALVLSGIYGAVHLLLYRQLRKKHFGPIYTNLPDLELLAQLTRQAALMGFLILTLGMNLGIGMAHARDVAGFNYTDPHVLSVLVLWLHFGLIAFSKRIGLLSARHSSIAAAAGLVVVVTSLILTALPSWTFHTIG